MIAWTSDAKARAKDERGCGRSVRVREYADGRRLPDGGYELGRFIGLRHGTCGRDATCDDCARADLALGGRD